jgi:hypothetical protein
MYACITLPEGRECKGCPTKVDSFYIEFSKEEKRKWAEIIVDTTVEWAAEVEGKDTQVLKLYCGGKK